jgi:hypothetical protein
MTYVGRWKMDPGELEVAFIVKAVIEMLINFTR